MHFRLRRWFFLISVFQQKFFDPSKYVARGGMETGVVPPFLEQLKFFLMIPLMFFSKIFEKIVQKS
jgi:hypothetical protein